MKSTVAPLVVRALEPDDYDFVVALSARVFGMYTRDPVASTLSMIDEPGVDVAVAELDGEPVGFVVVRIDRYARDFGPWPRPAIARLNAIAVVPELFGAGIGSRLLAYAERAARRHGAIGMSLMTAKTNTRARALFTSAGFMTVAPLGRVYAKRQIAVAMMKAL